MLPLQVSQSRGRKPFNPLQKGGCALSARRGEGQPSPQARRNKGRTRGRERERGRESARERQGYASCHKALPLARRRDKPLSVTFSACILSMGLRRREQTAFRECALGAYRASLQLLGRIAARRFQVLVLSRGWILKGLRSTMVFVGRSVSCFTCVP